MAKKKKRQGSCLWGRSSQPRSGGDGTSQSNPGGGNSTACGNPCLASVKGLSQMAFCWCGFSDKCHPGRPGGTHPQKEEEDLWISHHLCSERPEALLRRWGSQGQCFRLLRGLSASLASLSAVPPLKHLSFYVLSPHNTLGLQIKTQQLQRGGERSVMNRFICFQFVPSTLHLDIVHCITAN